MKKIFLLFALIIIGLFIALPVQQSYAEDNNALLEFCTGNWCGYCPCGHQIATNIQNQRPNTLILAYHGGYSDPWQYFNGYEIRGILGLSSYPTGIVSRMSGVISRSAWSGWVNVVSGNYAPGISYNVNKSYNSGTRQLTINLTATALRNIDTSCYINLVIYEDNLIYPQYFYEACGTPGYHNDYVHHWVVRTMANGALGELLKASPWTQNTTATKNWTITLDASWVPANCEVALFAWLQGSEYTYSSPVMQTWKQGVTTTGIGQPTGEVPQTYSLSQNYPNPFNPVTNIQFSIPKNGNVTLKIYDMVGNLVATYLDENLKAGIYNAQIDGSNWSSGVYFYTLSTSDFTQTKKMTLVK
jgi:hypothetical protein